MKLGINALATVFVVLGLITPILTQTKPYNLYGVLTNPHTSSHVVLTLDSLQEAKSLKDIYSRYDSSWVKDYYSVKISSLCCGQTFEATSKNDILTKEQLNLFKNLKESCTVQVKVRYLPKNELQFNPEREMSFSMLCIPIREAKHSSSLRQLAENLYFDILKKTGEQTFDNIKLAKYRFTVTEKGTIGNLVIHESSNDPMLDKAILDEIKNWGDWSPAKDHDDFPISQQFEFVFGTDLMRCDYQY